MPVFILEVGGSAHVVRAASREELLTAARGDTLFCKAGDVPSAREITDEDWAASVTPEYVVENGQLLTGGQGRRSFAFVVERFPILTEVLPPASRLAPFRSEIADGLLGECSGCCTHAEVIRPDWFREGPQGGRYFYGARCEVPDSFFAAGIRGGGAGSTEHVVVMWKVDHRLFYFQCKSVHYYDGNAYDEARSSLETCLQDWWRGEPYVLWCDRKIWPPIGPETPSSEG